MSKLADCHRNKAESHFTNRGKSWSRTEGSGGKNREKGKVKTNTGEIRREKTTKATDIARIRIHKRQKSRALLALYSKQTQRRRQHEIYAQVAHRSDPLQWQLQRAG